MFVLECYSKPQVRGTMSPDTETAAARISGRGLAGPVLRRRAVEVKGAFFEGAHHAAHRLVEQHFDQPLQQARLEFEIDKKTDAASALNRGKAPVIGQITEWPLGIGDIDLLWRVERDARGKALSEHAKADDQIGDNEIGLALFDADADTPGQELGIAFDIGDEGEELLGRVRQHPLFRVGRHCGGPSRRRRAWRFAPPATARNHPPRDRKTESTVTPRPTGNPCRARDLHSSGTRPALRSALSDDASASVADIGRSSESRPRRRADRP